MPLVSYTSGMETPKTYTRNQVADILNVSLSTVGLLVNSKRIFHIRVGKNIRIPQAALDDYLAGRPAKWPESPIEAEDGSEYPTPSVFEGGADNG